MKIIKGGVTSPLGFTANAVKAGIKRSKRLDLALLCSEVPAIAAAAFTKNKFQASPIKISSAHLRNRTHRALIVNSGNANCANGRAGDRDALLMTELAADALAINSEEVLVASTGVIGKYLPILKIKGKIPELVDGLDEKNGSIFAQAVMTTDRTKKELAVKFKLGTSIVTIGGACKGVGMIYPELEAAKHATMLCFLTTDAAISRKLLEDALGESIGDSFNMISVDGDMSTNDSCFLLANGLAGNKKINQKFGDYKDFTAALGLITMELGKMLVKDGEGATKFVEIEVKHAQSEKDAKRVARKVSTSNLLKCCVFGGDPNWGRVVAACGSSDANIDPLKVDIYLGGVKVFANGERLRRYNEEKVKRLFRGKDIGIKIDLKNGGHKAIAWTCDLSKEYVAINSKYST
ncbi:MAG: bifunctional glutamate N-acetyltransferase/amino-acid acetyltransferase ArgJ [Candidatus Omnitrophica bacterium]|nr:bifunctional glutamate N-acetyltransferase/amino-acid acetyltransferase ArgJ [Candidatus Omnitrophota bacterium]MBU4488927.1 bifunctional glutamate N-acetyltransferase/amino-acid acetyltransferase ArgJ [Candidatus Omnitrophota bacterium]MCG2705323.1 bifunctional glutamate N-acetyltransferase/amino-acid acetyltransferase ArgJ [Candidatus Omnitrophota bacterium]